MTEKWRERWTKEAGEARLKLVKMGREGGHDDAVTILLDTAFWLITMLLDEHAPKKRKTKRKAKR